MTIIPPHFHAFYQGFEAIFDVRDGKKIGGKLPVKAEKIVFEWAEKYKKNLLEDWGLVKEGKSPKKIPGADQ